MDFGKAFTFAFEDPDWLKKILINGLIGLIPLVGQIYLMGWGLEVARRIAMGGPAVLSGCRLWHLPGPRVQSFLVSLVWAAPIWLVSLVFAAVAALTPMLIPTWQKQWGWSEGSASALSG